MKKSIVLCFVFCMSGLAQDYGVHYEKLWSDYFGKKVSALTGHYLSDALQKGLFFSITYLPDENTKKINVYRNNVQCLQALLNVACIEGRLKLKPQQVLSLSTLPVQLGNEVTRYFSKPYEIADILKKYEQDLELHRILKSNVPDVILQSSERPSIRREFCWKSGPVIAAQLLQLVKKIK